MEVEDTTVVTAHAVAGPAYQDTDGLWAIPLVCQLEDDTMTEVHVTFLDEQSTKEVVKHFNSSNGMNPIEFIV